MSEYCHYPRVVENSNCGMGGSWLAAVVAGVVGYVVCRNNGGNNCGNGALL